MTDKDAGILGGKYYPAFKNWYEESIFKEKNIETALYHAYIAGRIDEAINKL